MPFLIYSSLLDIFGILECLAFALSANAYKSL